MSENIREHGGQGKSMPSARRIAHPPGIPKAFVSSAVQPVFDRLLVLPRRSSKKVSIRFDGSSYP